MSVAEILFSQNWIISLIFALLIAISFFSWYLIFRKIIFFKAEQKIVDNFSVNEKNDTSIAAQTLLKSFAILEGGKKDNQEIVAKKIFITLEEVKEKINFGHNFLASIANLTPFIGLFGTVLGVYFALIDISNHGNANIAVVARPIGEALIATAMGLWCAIPASFAFNAFSKKSALLVRKIKILIDKKSIEIEENRGF